MFFVLGLKKNDKQARRMCCYRDNWNIIEQKKPGTPKACQALRACLMI